MPKLAANLTMLYNEVEFLDRFALAAGSGFTGVEYLFPYAYPKDLLAEKLSQYGLEQVLHNLPAGDWAAGSRGIACQPENVARFQESVGIAIEYAKALRCSRINCLAGIPSPGTDRDKARATFVGNLRFAAAELAAAGIKLLIEPINTFDMPGFYLNRTSQSLEILRDVGSDNLFIQYDIYHMQRMEGELANTIKANLPRIAHIQLADNPGRNEPGTGEINFRFLFGLIDSLGYEGWIGCEYRPAGKTVDGLGWRSAHGA